MFLRRTILIPAILAWSVVAPSAAWAGPKTQAAREAAELILRKFGKEAAEEGVEKLTVRIEALALKYGDDAVTAARKGGPRALRAVEKAGSRGAVATKLLAREGDNALWIVERPERLKLFAAYGDNAAAAMLKHKALAEPLVSTFRQPAARALTQLDGRNARRLAMMADEGSLATIGRTDALLGVVGRYGNRAMDFIWKNKKALAATAALTAFLANPEPFIDGTVNLARDFVRPVAETIGAEAAKRADWTWLGITALVVLGCYASLKFYARQRLRAMLARRA
ncbi:MAG TPA: hypothetical protein VMV69_17030 [Pirellulales bacterium]|nr:hypothetical protein [Pirellulales bacterium]